MLERQLRRGGRFVGRSDVRILRCVRVETRTGMECEAVMTDLEGILSSDCTTAASNA